MISNQNQDDEKPIQTTASLPQVSSGTVINTVNLYVVPPFAGLLAAVTIALCYVFSVHNGSVAPFPQTDITHTARYPPSEYIFRIGIPVAMVVLQQIWWVLWSWMKAESARLGVSARTEKLAFILGVVGANLLILASVLIQPGDMDWTLHIFGATGFFICTYLAQVLTTNKLQVLKDQDGQVTSNGSMKLKWFVIWFAGAALLLDAFSSYVPSIPYLANILEYVLTVFVLIWFVSCAADFKDRLVTNLVLLVPQTSTSNP